MNSLPTPKIYERVAIFVVAILLCSVAGCGMSRGVPYDAAPITTGVIEKDTTIANAADRIADNNQAAPDSPQKPLIAADVKVIEDALAKLPAAEVAKALATMEAERNDALKQATTWKKKADDAESGVWARVQFWLGLLLYAGSVGCLILAGIRVQSAISTGVPTMKSIKGIVGLVSMASSLYTLARFLTAWWFPWAMGGVVFVSACWFGYTIWKARRDEAKGAALTPVRNRLDAAYEEADEATKALLDKLVFNPLSEDMKKLPEAKKIIRLDRATA